MPRQGCVMIVLTIGLLANLYYPSSARAAEAAKFASPAAVISAAEDAFGQGKFEALAACFDAEGQKQMARSYVEIFAMELSEGSGPDAQKVKDLLAKHGVKDVAKKAGETDEQFANRLTAQLKDAHAFMIEATPLAFPNPNHKAPIKGELKDLKIDGAKAQATYSVKQSGGSMDQKMTFAQADGSWKIAKAIAFVSPED